MTPAMVGVLGALTGLHAATWGAFKDTPFEGFRVSSFARSVVVGAAAAVLLGLTTDLGSTEPLVVVIGVVYAVERLATEWWKTFLREDAQSCYAIPMRLAVLGRPVEARLPRHLAGLAVGVLLVSAVGTTATLGPTTSSPLALTLLGAGLGGWLTAAGGAWKDAPVEGFSGWKFLRSPVVATAWGWLLLASTTDVLVLVVAAGGLSVLTIETYKTFLTGGRPPGKFSGKPVCSTGQRARHTCRMVHSGLYLLCGCWLLGTLVREDVGSRVLDPVAASIGAVGLVALVMCVLVVGSQPVGRAPAAVSAGGQRRARLVAMLGWWRTYAGPRPEPAQPPDAHVDLRGEGT